MRVDSSQCATVGCGQPSPCALSHTLPVGVKAVDWADPDAQRRLNSVTPNVPWPEKFRVHSGAHESLLLKHTPP